MNQILACGIALLMFLFSGSGAKPVQAHEVTNPAELAGLWTNYFNYTSVPLQHEFSSLEEIDPNDRVQYCIYSYLHQYGAEGLEHEGEDWYSFSKEQMNGLMKWYFDWYPEQYEGLDPELMNARLGYDAESEEFLAQWPMDDDWITAGKNAWGMYLESFRYNGDGTATAVVARSDWHGHEGEPIERNVYTMGVRAEGILYFLSMEKVYTQTDWVEPAGPYVSIPEMSAQEWFYQGGSRFYDIRFFVEDNTLTLAAMERNSGDEKTWRLLQYALPSLEYKGMLRVSVPDWYVACLNVVSVQGRPGLISKDGVHQVNEDFTGSELRTLPEALQQEMDAEEKIPIQFVAGYDVTDDLRFWTWCNAEGLQLLDTRTGEAYCLRENELFDSGKFGIMGYQNYPRFLGDGRYVLCVVYGYEWVHEWVLVSAATGEAACFSGLEWEVLCTGENGMVLLRESEEESGLYYCDYESGALTKLDFDTDNYITEEWIAGENGMAFTTAARDRSQDIKVKRLYRLDPDSRSITDTGMSISSQEDVRIELLALLPDGSVLANYSVHPGEREVFLVPGTETGAQ